MTKRGFDLVSRTWDVARAMAIAARPMRRGPRHALDAPMIVSLTSYPPRFKTLHLTLRTLLNQSVSPDRIVLWISDQDIGMLPAQVRDLVCVEIRLTDDLRSLKKLLPAYEQFPDHYIVTADDDVAYRHHWLRDLLNSAMPGTRDVVAHNVRRFVTSGETMAPIARWNMNARDRASLQPSDDLFPVGVAGVLFPPRSLHVDVSRRDLFLALCPTCDDSWLAWMIFRAGTKVRRSAVRQHKLFAWFGTNAGSLSADNFSTADGLLKQDAIFARLSEQFGPLHALKDVEPAR